MERLKKKLITARCDTEFIKMCLIYGLTPKFVRFKLSNLNHRKLKNFNDNY